MALTGFAITTDPDQVAAIVDALPPGGAVIVKDEAMSKALKAVLKNLLPEKGLQVFTINEILEGPMDSEEHRLIAETVKEQMSKLN